MSNAESEENSLCGAKPTVDKGFNEWRQPEPPKSPLELVDNKILNENKETTLCSVKDLSRLSRKRRTILVAKNGRVYSRKRTEEKDSVAHNESKPRITKKEPLPMRQRCLPQSFFQQPNTIQCSSLGQNTYSRLPPLYPQEHNPDEEITERPVTPPEERKKQTPKLPKRVTSQPNTELLFSLFKVVLPNDIEKKIIRRGRPKKVHSQKTILPNPKHEEDPCMVQNVMGKLFPQLSLENKSKLPRAILSSVCIQNGNNCVELPTLAVEDNYPKMLQELALVL